MTPGARAATLAGVEGFPGRYSIRLADGRQFGPVPMDGILSWAREGRVGKDAWLIAEDESIAPRLVIDVEPLARVVSAPPTVSTGVRAPAPRSASAVIPTANPAALGGYYCAIFAMIPFVGTILAPIAIVLGLVGLARVRRYPDAKGTFHAWVGIAGGAFVLALQAGVVILLARLS